MRFFKSHWGLIFPDTLDIVFPFCDQEFKFSRNLRQHCRKEHKDSLSGITHFSTLQENATQQNLQQRSTVQHELVSLQQGSIVQQGFVSLQQGSTVQQQVVRLSKQFFCENCDKVFHTKDTLKRHIKEKHANIHWWIYNVYFVTRDYLVIQDVGSGIREVVLKILTNKLFLVYTVTRNIRPNKIWSLV